MSTTALDLCIALAQATALLFDLHGLVPSPETMNLLPAEAQAALHSAAATYHKTNCFIFALDAMPSLN